ncbi:MAG: LacI family DNA-binding transcriptional regulator [Pseudomonadota bacterium]
MANLKEVAKKAGVSPATVSYVFSGNKPIGAAVRKKVLAVADALGYRPDRYAQAMRTGRTNTIGLLLPNILNGYFPELAQAIENRAHELGYSVILVDAQSDEQVERDGFKRLLDQRVDGILWCPIYTDPLPPIPKCDKPIVFVDAMVVGEQDHVCSDNAAVGKLIANYIAKLGHKEIGLLIGPRRIASASERTAALRAAVQGRFSVIWEEEIPLTAELTRAAVQQIQYSQASFIVAPSDIAAIRTMKVLREAGRRVPEDVSVMGYDDMPWSELMHPSLTTVNQSTYAIGRESIDLLISRLDSEPELSKRVLLDVKLVERESTRSLFDQ